MYKSSSIFESISQYISFIWYRSIVKYMIIVQCRRVKYRLLKYYYFYYTITNFGQALYLADDARAKLCATVNGKLNAAQERQTKSPTSTTGTGTTSRSMQNYLNANTESESRHGV